MSSYQRGFTLLEITIALAILAGVSAAVAQIFASGVETTIYVEQESHAYLLAESKMEEILLSETVKEYPKSGQIEGTDFYYQLHIEEQEYPGKPRYFELIHLSLTISWGDTDKPFSLSLESLKTEKRGP